MKIIGNIRDFQDKGTKGPGLFKSISNLGNNLGVGDRTKRLTSTALDRGEQQARVALDDIIPPMDDLTPEQQEQFLSGLDLALDAISGATGPGAEAAIDAIGSLYEACAGIHDQVDGHETLDSSYGLVQPAPTRKKRKMASAGVDVIGFDGPAWNVGSIDDDEWR